MTMSITCLEDIEERMAAAEIRRKKAEAEKMEKLSQKEKHAEEVRAKKEKIKAEETEKSS